MSVRSCGGPRRAKKSSFAFSWPVSASARGRVSRPERAATSESAIAMRFARALGSRRISREARSISARLRAAVALSIQPDSTARFRVAGVLQRSGTSDDNLFFIPLAAAQEAFRQRDRLSAVAVRLKDPADMTDVIARFTAIRDCSCTGSIRVCAAGAEPAARKPTTATAIQVTPFMPYDRLSSASSMSRRAIFLAAALLIFSGTVAASVLVARPAPAQRLVRPVPPRRTLRLPATLPRRTITLPILMYHRIGRIGPELASITQRLSVTPGEFAAQMRWLKRNNFHAVTQEQAFAALERGATLPSRPIMITFDDGYRDVLFNAAPVLKRLRMRATAYVITSRISGADVSFLSWAMLHALEQDGIEIGSHTVHHAEIPSLSDPAGLQELILDILDSGMIDL